MTQTESPRVASSRRRRPRLFSSPFFLANGNSFRRGHASERFGVELDVFTAMTHKGAARKRRLDELMAKIDGLPSSRRKRLGAIARKEIAKFRAEDKRDPDWTWGIRNDALWPPNLGGTAT